MLVSDFHFDLPVELIAQHPPAERGASRMLVLDRCQVPGTRDQQLRPADQGWLQDAMFRDLPEYLRAGDLLVLNDSRVLPARLFAARAGAPGVIEVLLVEEVGPDPTSEMRDVGHPLLWRALVKPAKKVRVGERLLFGGAVDRSEGELVARGPGLKPHVSELDNRGLKPAANPKDNSAVTPSLTAEVVEAGEFGERTLRFGAVEDFYGVVGRIGHMPLPPYIRRKRAAGAKAPFDEAHSSRGLKPAATPGGIAEDFEAEDRERYQTVYAHEPGSAAAPTAGLHFTAEMLAALRERGVEIAYVTLHVGLGTFQPVRVEDLKDIQLHAERYTLPAATADALNRAVAEGRRVVAVGTTTTRTLEHIAAEMGIQVENEKRVPGAKAPMDSEAVMPGLKSRPISGAQQSPPPISGAQQSPPPISGAQQSPPPISGAQQSPPPISAAQQSPPPISAAQQSPRPISGAQQSPPISEAPSGKFEAHSGATSIFIGPGHRFRIVGGLLTNFHLPESTLLMLVAAFAGDGGDAEEGRRRVLAAYAHAVREGYRFYSYGDCMLVV